MIDNELKGSKSIVVQTFDYNCHVFNLISDNNQYYLMYENDSKLITKLIIKPDLWVFYKDGGYDHGIKLLKPLNPFENKVLSMDFSIDPEIFNISINNELISYSKAMADLYQFPIAYSKDIKYHHNDYKRSKNKNLILSNMKQGKFN